MLLRFPPDSGLKPYSLIFYLTVISRCHAAKTFNAEFEMADWLERIWDQKMHIGLIGGIGPAATDYYYRALIRAFASQDSELETTIVHADAPTLLANMADDRFEEQVAIYERLTKRLERAGAECVVITSIAGHFCIEKFKQISTLPVVDLLMEVDRAVSAMGGNCLGILGTRTVMESRFYGAIGQAEVIFPEEQLLAKVHEAYTQMATSGIATQDHQLVFDEAGKQMMMQGAQAIMLGGTDLALVYNGEHSPFPILDCAAIHVDAIVKKALMNE